MNESSIFSEYESSDYYGYEFDYQADFTQFLEEARKNASQGTPNNTHLQAERKKQLNGEKKNRKSWKKSLFFWLKTDKESKTTKVSTNNTRITKPSRGIFSGPVEGSEQAIKSRKLQRPASGPLTGLFSSTRRVEDPEVPYMCLRQLSNPQKLQYGPVYLVT